MTNISEEGKELVVAITKKLADEGKLVEAGWQSLRIMAVDPSATAIQLVEMRMAFFAGAQHLFGSIMSIMDADVEPTENDLKKMDQISKELNTFIDEFRKRYNLHEVEQ